METELEKNMDKIAQLRNSLNKYSGLSIQEKETEAAKDIGLIVTPEAMKIITNPKKYDRGDELRRLYLANIKLLYIICAGSGNIEAKDKIFNFIHQLYMADKDAVYSVNIQNAIVRHFNSFNSSKEDKVIAERLFDIIEYYFKRNLSEISKIKSSARAAEKEALISAHQITAETILLHGDSYRQEKKGTPHTVEMLKKVSGKEKFGEFASQLFGKEYLDIYEMFSETLYDKFMDKKKKKAFIKFLRSASDLISVLRYISDNGIPGELGCYFITAAASPKVLHSVYTSELVAQRYRIYALKTLAQRDYEEEDIMFYVDNFKSLRTSVLNLLGNEDLEANEKVFDSIAELREKSKKTLIITEKDKEDFAGAADSLFFESEAYFQPLNPFSDNIDTEIRMAALIFKAAKEIGGINIFKSLKKMPTVMTFVTKSSENGYEKISDTHGSLILQDVSGAANEESNKLGRLTKIIDNLSSFIVLEKDAKIFYSDIEKYMKNYYGLTEKDEAAEKIEKKKEKPLWKKIAESLGFSQH
jgi:hypothetical protein